MSVCGIFGGFKSTFPQTLQYVFKKNYEHVGAVVLSRLILRIFLLFKQTLNLNFNYIAPTKNREFQCSKPSQTLDQHVLNHIAE